MPFVPVPNCATFALRGTYLNEQVVNTLSFFRGAGWPAPALSDFAQILQDWWFGILAPHIPSGVVMQDVYALSLDSTTAPSVVVPFQPGVSTGQLAGNQMPGNVTFCISFRTAARGRSGRGRNYIMGLVENDVLGNQISLARANALQAAYSQLITIAAEELAQWVVIQKFSNGNQLSAGVPRPVISVTYADLNVDTMSGRLPR